MKNDSRHNELKKLLIQRLALIIAVFYLLSPFQQQLSNLLHTLSHDLSLPDYVMTHSSPITTEGTEAHQYGDHRTGEIIHEHLIIDFVQSLLGDPNDDEQQTDPLIPTKSVDKHLVIYSYSLENKPIIEHKNLLVSQEQRIRAGHPKLWLKPPISIIH